MNPRDLIRAALTQLGKQNLTEAVPLLPQAVKQDMPVTPQMLLTNLQHNVAQTGDYYKLLGQDPRLDTPEQRIAAANFGANMLGSIDEAGLAKAAQPLAAKQLDKFQGLTGLSTKVVERMKGMKEVSPETITNLSKSPDVKQAERELLTKVMDKHLSKAEPEAPQLYHGTRSDFKGFDPNFDYENAMTHTRDYETPEGMVFLTTDKREASAYGPKVVPVELKGKKILTVKTESDAPSRVFDDDYNGAAKMWREFQDGAYDALEIKGPNKSTFVTYPELAHASETGGGINKVASKIPVQQFAEDVQKELLPLSTVDNNKFIGDNGYLDPSIYKSRALNPDLRGNVTNYQENLYESPIKTSAGDTHWGDRSPNYFGHTRTEDVRPDRYAMTPENGAQDISTKLYDEQVPTTRRVLELQSDLFQKGRLEQSLQGERHVMHGEGGSRTVSSDTSGLDKLKPYENTWHERLIREEVKKAAQDGKTKLQFPVGDTAMKIEGLEQNNWYHTGYNAPDRQLVPNDLKVGMSVTNGPNDGEWVITDVSGDGKFKAIQKSVYDRATKTGLSGDRLMNYIRNEYWSDMERFDISGKANQNDPIYKFYESEVGKYLKNKYGAQRITDPQGVEWWEVPIKPEHGKAPVEAFGIAGAVGALKQQDDKKHSDRETMRSATKQLR
jgi:hypothetical protein